MKKQYFLALAFVVPVLTSAHDGSLHTETWYQFFSVPALIMVAVAAVIVAGIGYYNQFGTLVSASVGLMVLAIGFMGTYYSAIQTTPASPEVAEQLQGEHMTLYRTPGCSCCSEYAKELEQTGADVTVETVDAQEMQQLKDTYNISREQQSCHTTIVGDYVVEGHVPFAALAKLLTDEPDITGIALPGMPIGTPGMPGRQTETYNVQTVEGDLFWSSAQ